ncbi:cadherin repeat domain-containing protein [Maribacter flavus]|uniref:Cadherin repeat domain-containing protein n=1 Tax=Maribacter flavus TaxID=1658664 RepID=A0A5B2TWI8_9FLAO|nr:cadherin repeat domain-containing protein [Maribacter flavus]KAA2218807.1 cadherin repeat domain-containing protein [Maribacter flavus]
MIKQILNVKIFIALVLLISVGCNKDDDQPSTVNLQNLEVSLDENPSNGETVGTVQTTNGTAINYSISSQLPSGALSIDSSSGELTVANATLFDFETNPTITATITADNAENSVTVTITLNNTNEVTAQNLEVTIDENPTAGQVLGSLQTMGNASGFTITTQSPVGAMDIDSNSGELIVADASLFDFETNPTLTATVSIEDAANPVTVTVTLTDVLEITVQDFTVAVDENPTDGQVLGTVQATGNGAFDFSITSQTPMGAMAIDATTGELTVIDPNLFDFETNPVITAEISVTDGVESTSLTATINLNDVDEVSAQNTDLNIDENPSNGDIIGSLQASGSNLTYTITFQNPAGAFAINQSTGELSVANETLFDFETNPNMLATISVSNGTQTVSANTFVELNDLNEIGEYKYGGVIFWIDPASNNSEGLVCDINNQGFTSWSCSNTVDITGATGTAIGTGATNTMAIISNSCTSSSGAANIIAALNVNGYNDWFLPSKDELTEMYLNRNIIDSTSAVQGGSDLSNPAQPISHWSSSQSTSDVNKAWIRLFVNGSENEVDKTVIITSRAVRAWTDF